MEDQNSFASTKKLLDSSSSVIIILPGDPSQDLVSAGLSLHLSLQSAGKKTQIGCGSEVHVDPKIQGAEEIVDSIGDRNLVISFDYQEDDLEKVDYDVRPDGKFYLMIKPKAGSPVPDVSNVKYSYSGASSDLVITLGINSLEELGKIYADEKKFLDSAKILSLNTSPRPVSFSQNILHQTANSFSELVAELLEKTGFKPSSPAASNLLNSIYEETKNLTSAKMTANTFSSISFLMRHGARLPNQLAFVPRFSQPAFFENPVGAINESPASVTPADLSTVAEAEGFTSLVGGSPYTPTEEDNIPLPPEENPADSSLRSPASGGRSTPTWQSPSTNQISPQLESFPVPNDWTKPKIFRATDL